MKHLDKKFNKNGKDLARAHKKMRETLKSTTAWRVRQKLVEKGYLPKC